MRVMNDPTTLAAGDNDAWATGDNHAASRDTLAEAHALHAQCPPIDLHADPLLWSRFVGYDLNKRHRPPFPQARFGGHTDLPRMREGGLGAQVFGLVSLPGLDRDLSKACHRQIDLLEQAIRTSQGQLRLSTSAEDIDKAQREGAMSGLLAIEGAHALRGNIDALDRFYARGVRSLGLLHFTRNACGSPCGGPGARRRAPLTPFGHDLVAHCEALGVIVDLAHLNHRGCLDVCAVAKKPVWVSHTGLAGVHASWRNIDDEQLRAVASTGGVVGVIFVPYYLGRDGLDAVIDHLLHIVRMAGEHAPALGSDWDGFVRPTRGLEESSKLPHLTARMLERGLRPTLIEGILRHNALRMVREVLRPPA